MNEEYILLTLEEQKELFLPLRVSEKDVIDKYHVLLSIGEFWDYSFDLFPKVFLKFNTINDIKSVSDIISFCLHTYYITEDLYQIIRKVGTQYLLNYKDEYTLPIIILMNDYSHIDSLEKFIDEISIFYKLKSSYDEHNNLRLSYNYEDHILDSYFNYKNNLKHISMDFFIKNCCINILSKDLVFDFFEIHLEDFLDEKIKKNEIDNILDFIYYLYLFVDFNNHINLYNIIFKYFLNTKYEHLYEDKLTDNYFVNKERYILSKQMHDF